MTRSRLLRELPEPVHTLHASTEQRRLTLNWEHDCYRLVEQSRVRRFDGQVAWLHHLNRALGMLEESIACSVCADATRADA